jgi:hypothetical protein
MGETTEIIRRRVRHWKTTITGIALAAAPVAMSVWPEQSGLIAKIVAGLAGAGFILAADAKPQTEEKK